MSDEVKRLRAVALGFENARALTATRYSTEFRDRVVAVARQRRAAGVPIVRIASELGLRGRTLARWLRSAPKRRFRRVRLARSEEVTVATSVGRAPGALTVSVGAMRIEGLDIESVAQLVRALGA